MNTLDVSAPAPNVINAHHPDDTQKVRRAAADFEALLVEQLLRAAQPEGGGDSPDASALLDVGRQQFAHAIASGGGLGIAKMVMAGLGTNANR